MYRLAFAVSLVALPPICAAADCRISGTAYDVSGKPTPAIVRLVDIDSGQQVFAATDRHAAFAVGGIGNGPYRLDLLSRPTVVTGSRLPTRSIVGQSSLFTCAAGEQMQDVRAEVD